MLCLKCPFTFRIFLLIYFTFPTKVHKNEVFLMKTTILDQKWEFCSFEHAGDHEETTLNGKVPFTGTLPLRVGPRR